MQKAALRALLQALVPLLVRLLLRLKEQQNSYSATERVYNRAHALIGSDASPADTVDDDVGCAESVSQVLNSVIKFPIIPGTWTLMEYLRQDPRFKRTSEKGGVGTIILCATGEGNGSIRGHVGILGENGSIMSATSADGIWRANYTLDTWRKRYVDRGGFPIHYFTVQ